MGKKIIRVNPDSSGLTDEQIEDLKFLILHNDEINTFDHVITSLIDICEHDPLQAEQCAYITHYRGQCDIKRGARDILRPLRDSLLNRGLQVTID